MSDCEHDYVYNHEFRLTRCSKCLVVKKEFDWEAQAEKAEARVHGLKEQYRFKLEIAEAENAKLRNTLDAMLAQAAEHMQVMSKLWIEKR